MVLTALLICTEQDAWPSCIRDVFTGCHRPPSDLTKDFVIPGNYIEVLESHLAFKQAITHRLVSFTLNLNARSFLQVWLDLSLEEMSLCRVLQFGKMKARGTMFLYLFSSDALLKE